MTKNLDQNEFQKNAFLSINPVESPNGFREHLYKVQEAWSFGNPSHPYTHFSTGLYSLQIKISWRPISFRPVVIIQARMHIRIIWEHFGGGKTNFSDPIPD